MAKRFADFALQKDYYFLPIGHHAASDMGKIVRLFHPFDASVVEQFHDSILSWGYFVEESKYETKPVRREGDSVLKVLYIGRLLKLKRVDTIIKAVALANHQTKDGEKITLDIYGNGPEEKQLKALAQKIEAKTASSPVTFYPAVPLSEVRSIMRDHDLVVFASNAFDGWGAVVSEALSEGIPVLGTYETGASVTLLQRNSLFYSGDYRELAGKIIQFLSKRGGYTAILQDAYTPHGACNRLMTLIKS